MDRLPSWIAWEAPDEANTKVRIRRTQRVTKKNPTAKSSPTSPDRKTRRRNVNGSTTPLVVKKKIDARSTPELFKERSTSADSTTLQTSSSASCSDNGGTTVDLQEPSVLFPKDKLEENLKSEVEWERKYLLQVCQECTQDVNWSEFIQRLKGLPQVLEPVSIVVDVDQAPRHQRSKYHISSPHGPSRKRVIRRVEGSTITSSSTKDDSEESNNLVFETTILGAMVAMDMEGHCMQADQKGATTISEAIQVALELCPRQVRCSQRFEGHTPLRDAACNPTCDAAVLSRLAQVDRALGDDMIGSFSAHVKDRDGLSLMDHLLHTIQLGPFQDKALTRLEAYLRHTQPTFIEQQQSPLIYFLTLGTSFGVLPGAASVVATISSAGLDRKDPERHDRILETCRRIIHWNPALLHVKSHTTGCSAIHVAIRNYGNFPPLIRELIESDTEGLSMKHRNLYGDLPIHVACSVGVPMDILHLVLARTLMADCDVSRQQPHPLVWSTNCAGYTPVDLEWIRHIEAGHGFYSKRSFYPLDAKGVRRPAGRYDDMYDVLLRQAVDQILGRSSETKTALQKRPSSRDKLLDETGAFSGADERNQGLLLHRILLVIRAAFRDSFSRSPFDLSGDILHQASALCGPSSPALPRPVLELILWQHPEQLEQRDHAGRLPLHYALQQGKDPEGVSIKLRQEWRLWIQKILCHEKNGCTVRDNQGRLPLHYALEWRCSSPAVTHPQEALNTVARDLVERFPQSVDALDPVTHFFPFQLAASNSRLSLDTVYFILRRGPGVINYGSYS